MNTERPMTVNEVAEFLGISAYKVREYAKEGKLKGSKIGNGTNKKGSRRRWRFWRKDLVEFVNRGSNVKEKQ